MQLEKRKRCTHHGKVEALLVQLSEWADGAHLVRLEALHVRTRIVHFDHTWADIDTYELCDVRREGARHPGYRAFVG